MNGEPELRIGDAEREAAASALGEHFASGRLTREEYDERSGKVWSARTNSDLWPLFADLPSPHVTQQHPSWATTGATTGPTTGATTSRPRPEWRGRRGPWFGLPLFPVIAVVAVLVVLTHVPWPVFILLGWLWFAGCFGRGWRGRG